MPGSMSLLGFIAAALVLLLTPGPGVMYIVARSIGQGSRAGLVSVVGLAAGALVHVARLPPEYQPFFSRRRPHSASSRRRVLRT